MIVRKRILAGILILVMIAPPTFAYNPPTGGESAVTFQAPLLLGGNASMTGGAFGPVLPGEMSLNPALGAAEQRITVDASYAALIGTKDDTGFGHVLNAGILYPTRWSVLSGSLSFLTSPFDTLQYGTAATLNAAISKELTERFSIGAGLSASAGTGWGAYMNLGMLYKLGAIGFMQETRIGAGLTGLGRPYTPPTEGVKGGKATAMPSMITPRAGFAGTLLDTGALTLGASADLSAPFFQNLVFDAGLEAVILDKITISSGWNFNLVETLNDRQSWQPSVAVGVNLAIDSTKQDAFLSRHGWGQSEIKPSVAVKPLAGGVIAVGGGANMQLGVMDSKAPAIIVDYPEPVYISPNNDGIQDELSFKVSISDQRYVLAWSFVIEDSNGTVVRTIANKEVRTEMQDIESFWKLLTKVKQGIPLPESLRWDGIMDSGETAPDGTYFFHITAQDDNKNSATTEKFTVYLDNTAPTVTALPPSGANAMIFSPDGDGNKDSFTIVQTGSIEDKWTAVVTDATGTILTRETFNAAPADFTWDGKNATGAITHDGVYAYHISTTDRAGNTAEARIDNIIVDTDKPSINVSIDINSFSPNGDSVRDAVQFAPSIPVQTGLLGWEIAVLNRDGTTVRRFTGTSVPKTVAFDGKNDSGSIVPEGDYQAVISARYVNGYAPVARSPFFNLDITKPEASTRASGPIFSPVGDGKLDTVTFAQQTSAEQSWTGQIFALDAEGKPTGAAILTLQHGSSPEASFVWNGRDDAGKLAPDGLYGYRLTSTDRAGNTGVSNIASVELNTEKADVILQANLSSFSPNGDGVKDAIIFTPVLKAATAVSRYTLTVTDSQKNPVRTFKGTGKVPASISWNGIADPLEGSSTGARVPDGMYSALLEVTLVNQQTSTSATPDFEIDTVYPEIEVSVPYLLLSPNGDGNRDTVTITQRSSAEDLWTGTFHSANGAIVKTMQWNGQAGSFEWDATDESGNKLPDGTYSWAVSAEDRAGNKTVRKLTGFQLDARVPKAYLTAELPSFSPNGDTIKDVQKLSIVTSLPDGLESWFVAIKSEGSPAGKSGAVKLWDSSTSEVLPATINWDGRDSSGKVMHGRYYAELGISYVKGDTVSATTPSFLVNAKAPALNVRLAPKYFSPDNDGNEDELFINLTAESISAFTEWSFEIREPAGTSGNLFWKTGGNGKITERIIWDGRSQKGELVQAATDYPFTFTVTDDVGMTSVVKGYIPVDVLIIRDGDKLKIAVPSIIFRENEADFIGLSTEVVDKNTQVLRRIAEILNKFRDYKIQVEGHANNVTGTQKEEDTELIPLSQRRAAAVKDFLVANGVDAARLSTIGMGGTRPVAKRSDRENWWKNRRVEFILIK